MEERYPFSTGLCLSLYQYINQAMHIELLQYMQHPNTAQGQQFAEHIFYFPFESLPILQTHEIVTDIGNSRYFNYF